MKILAINGSPNRRNTHALLEIILSEAEKMGAETEILNLRDYSIKECIGCDKCLKGECSQKDDINKVLEKMKEADAIVIGVPTYFGNVPGIVKNLIDRSRMARMGGFWLKNRVFAPVVTSGLRNGGAEYAIMSLLVYALGQGMIPVSIAENPITTGSFVIGTIQSDTGWRSVKKDEISINTAKALAKRIVEIARATEGLRK
ncbi:Multimeric flavodoxin WrbA [Archaeoglobus sulfaticallidus PM70-1]|uniref:Multimeric flavodoxin WrbA n=1 Tax=Archaeoglobus sulfaticallidus PM70-1 TaxID=387631 RepID=N0BFW7_9EURY|nr:flavodoxin family protein [Archaeoglobus sulfaticallidus]AGK61192.1 Multimeric flavodoxin WrbA [Archaeoglobus sulfaticallidus PM70-1]